MTISKELRSLSPSSMIVLYEIDTTPVGGIIYKFHNGFNELSGNIIWDGDPYNYFPVEAEGFEFSAKGQLPRPTLRISNINGLLGAIVRNYNDLIGLKVTRIRTFAKYLDAVNFAEGNIYADHTAKLPDDIYYIDRKSTENKIMIEFELAAAFDITNIKLPRRQIIQNMCPWKYRGAECGYTGSVYLDYNDKSTTQPNDICGKRLTSCQLRFGSNAQIPYGGFPAAGLIR